MLPGGRVRSPRVSLESVPCSGAWVSRCSVLIAEVTITAADFRFILYCGLIFHIATLHVCTAIAAQRSFSASRQVYRTQNKSTQPELPVSQFTSCSIFPPKFYKHNRDFTSHAPSRWSQLTEAHASDLLRTHDAKAHINFSPMHSLPPTLLGFPQLTGSAPSA